MLDVQKAIEDGDVAELQQVWNAYNERATWRRAASKFESEGKTERAETARTMMAELPDVSPAQALQANARLVDLLTGRRWFVIQEMREAGESWTAVGNALGMSKQAAWEWYKAKIERQEQYVPDFHDTARARAAL